MNVSRMLMRMQYTESSLVIAEVSIVRTTMFSAFNGRWPVKTQSKRVLTDCSRLQSGDWNVRLPKNDRCASKQPTEMHRAIHVRGLAPSAEEAEDRRSDEIIMTPAFLTFSFFIRTFHFLCCFNVSSMFSKQILNTYNNKCGIF